MLEETLRDFRDYNRQIGSMKSALQVDKSNSLGSFYEQHKKEFDELDRLAQNAKLSDKTELSEQELSMAIQTVEPGGFISSCTSPEQEKYQVASRILSKKINESLLPVGLQLNGNEGLTSSIIFDILKSNELNLEPTFYLIGRKRKEVIRIEDKGYELLCRLIGEVIRQILPDPKIERTYWGGEMDFISRFFYHGKWKHLNYDDIPMRHGITGVVHDVNSKGLPFAKESEDVAIIKTLGGVDEPTYQNFWFKMSQTLKRGGVIASSYDLPQEFQNQYRTIVNPAGIGGDQINFDAISIGRYGNHYFPKKMIFFRKK